jgi:hypothetical protein
MDGGRRKGLKDGGGEKGGMEVRALFFVISQSIEALLKLWCHECSRVFEDRLVSTEDRDWFQKLLRDRMSKDFKLDPAEVLGKGPLLYGDFMVANTDNKIYDEITDIDKVRNCLPFFLSLHPYLSLLFVPPSPPLTSLPLPPPSLFLALSLPHFLSPSLSDARDPC